MAKKSSVDRVAAARYLYSDGTLIECFEEKRDGVQIGQTCDVTFGYAKVSFHEHNERYGVSDRPEGRIIFSRYNDADAMVKFAKGSKVRVFVPNVERGSTNTRSHNIAVGHLAILTKYGWLKFDCFDIMGADFTIQASDKFPQPTSKEAEYYPGALWGYSDRIAKITDLRPKAEVAA